LETLSNSPAIGEAVRKGDEHLLLEEHILPNPISMD
jgi:hypothetical protein